MEPFISMVRYLVYPGLIIGEPLSNRGMKNVVFHFLNTVIQDSSFHLACFCHISSNYSNCKDGLNIS